MALAVNTPSSVFPPGVCADNELTREEIHLSEHRFLVVRHLAHLSRLCRRRPRAYSRRVPLECTAVVFQAKLFLLHIKCRPQRIDTHQHLIRCVMWGRVDQCEERYWEDLAPRFGKMKIIRGWRRLQIIYPSVQKSYVVF